MNDHPIPTEADRTAERRATRGMPEEAIHEWLFSDEELPFPSAIGMADENPE